MLLWPLSFSGELEFYFWFQFIKRRSGKLRAGAQSPANYRARAVGSLQGVHYMLTAWAGGSNSLPMTGVGDTLVQGVSYFLAISLPALALMWNIQGPGGSRAPRALCSGVSLSGIKNRAFSTSADPGRERPGQGSHVPRRSGMDASSLCWNRVPAHPPSA